MEKLKKAFGAFLVPLLSILLAFLIGGIIMAALGADPFLVSQIPVSGRVRLKGRHRHDADQGDASHVHRSLRVLRV